jgi:hypothetical protein
MVYSERLQSPRRSRDKFLAVDDLNKNDIVMQSLAKMTLAKPLEHNEQLHVKIAQATDSLVRFISTD